MAHRDFWMTIVLIAFTACSDDTVNPSNPDAGPSKDVAAEAAGKDAGDGGHVDAHADAGDNVHHSEADGGTSDAGSAD
jgi:hypothetical protein